jgi:hypothetical protein
MEFYEIILSILLTLLAYFSFFMFALSTTATGIDSGQNVALQDRLINGSITGGGALLCLFLVYKLSGITFTTVAGLPPILLIIYMSFPKV